jgi:regulator of nucleoside diphosphate kinase
VNRVPDIFVSTFDYDRLERLLQALPAGSRATLSGLQRELERAIVVEPESVPANVVTMNSVVTFTTAKASGSRSARLCFPKDADGSPDRLSVLTPVGTALLGLREGESINWAGPDGHLIEVRVQEVVHQPERSAMRVA